MKKTIDLGNSNTLKSVFRLMIPAMIAQWISVLYNIVDRIYIGNLPTNGSISLVGAGVCAPITTLVISFAYLVTYGASPLFSMSLGQGNKEDAEKIFSNAMLLLAVFSVVVTGLGYALLEPMLYLFGASSESFPYAHDYMIWFLTGGVFAFLSVGLNQFLVAQGLSIESMIGSLASCIFNIILDPIFLYTLNLGVKGAAIATAISWFLYFLLVLGFVLWRAPTKRFFGGYSWRIMRKILKLGVSPFIILCTDSVMVIALNIVLQQSGANGDFYIECSTIVQAFFSLMTGPLLGISSGTQPVLAYLFGARKVDLVKKAEFQITTCGLIFTTLFFISSFFTAQPFAELFLKFSPEVSSSAKDVIAFSTKYIHWYMYSAILLTFQYTLVDGLTGIGKAKYSIWLSVNRKFVLLLPLIFLLPYLSHNPEMAFLAEPIADGVAGIVSLVSFLIVMPRILAKQRNSKGSALDEV